MSAVDLELDRIARKLKDIELNDLSMQAISGNDAKSLAFIPSKSVDRILGINVVYFLDPMADYFKELRSSVHVASEGLCTC